MDIITLFSNRMPRLKSWIENTFPVVGKTMNKRRERIRTEAYKKYGIEMAKRFDECMQHGGYKYMLTAGSMLGAIREHGFIKHDMDMDVCMWISDYRQQMISDLRNYGFEWLYSYQIDGGKYGREDTFDYKGCRIDIFYVYEPIEEGRLPYLTDYWTEKGMKPGTYMPRRQEMPFVHEVQRVKFETIELPVPVNSDEQCRYRYGDDYMIPNPQWDNHKKVQCIFDWPEKISATPHLTYPTL